MLIELVFPVLLRKEEMKEKRRENIPQKCSLSENLGSGSTWGTVKSQIELLQGWTSFYVFNTSFLSVSFWPLKQEDFLKLNLFATIKVPCLQFSLM